MTVLYSNDFEGLTHLSTIPAFTNAGGGNFIVLGPTFSPAPPARGQYRYGAPDNADQNYWNGNTALTNLAMRHATKVEAGAYIAHCLRYNTTTGAAYRTYYEWDGINLRGTIAKWDGASTVSTQQSIYSVPYASGDVLHMESRAVGSTIELRLWTNSGARPASPLVTMTDSAYTTGAAGLRRVLGNSIYANVDDLVITDSTGGEDFFYASGPTISTQPTNQSVSSGSVATFTGAATGSGTLTYQWQRSTDGGTSWANVGTTNTGATTSYSTPATTVTGGSANNGDRYRFTVSDGTSTTTSSSAVLTVTAAAASATTLTNASPSNGYVGVASTNFTVGANGAITGTVVVTPNDGGAGGTFNPTTVSISSASPTGTFTYTPSTIGAKTISTTNNGGLANPTSVTYTANALPSLIVPMVNNTEQPLILRTIPYVTVQRLSTQAQILALTNQVTTNTGNLVVSSLSLTVGVSYIVNGWNEDGSSAFITQATAS